MAQSVWPAGFANGIYCTAPTYPATPPPPARNRLEPLRDRRQLSLFCDLRHPSSLRQSTNLPTDQITDTHVNTHTTMADTHTYKFNVSMSCSGCSGAVDRVLKKLEGVESYEVSLESQTATVVAKDDLPYEKVLATIAKTGKKVNTGEADGVAQSVEVAAAA
ncbi:hypothetical protein FJTKL_03539 [Diaporthe vaccinii]|uniref:HMA domain-containing protein n=1 Tax=Diaporthe vaccinii TaxID=105482 RepID=A0ABR4DV73_9PEZI